MGANIGRHKFVEPTKRVYFYVWLLGWANLLDGLIRVLSFTTLYGQFGIKVARLISTTRIEANRKAGGQ